MSLVKATDEVSSFAVLRDQRVILAVYSAAIFLSATLLFSVQPMFAKMVLPKLGGSPSVWAVSMCFFQALLLAGYCYAHLLNKYLEPRQAIVTHLVMLLAALAVLPIALPESANQAPEGEPYFWLIGVLAAGVGIPFFAISANAPLLQSWFARTGHAQARDPYFLYAASNIGSLAALLSYPIVVEPLLGLQDQGGVWSSGFALLGLCIAASGAILLANEQPEAPDASAVAPAVPIDTRQRAVWIALAFVPSALLVAFTTYLTSDIASAPFLWVIPLALFLGTFIVVFRDVPLIPHEALLDRLPLISAFALYGVATVGVLGFGITLTGSFAAFLIACLVCHRELYLRRPASSGLTEFYLWMSFGGVLGGVFSALLAPVMFTRPLEFPLLVAAGLCLRPAILDTIANRDEWKRVGLIVAGGAAGILLLLVMISAGLISASFKLPLIIMAALGAMMVAVRHSARQEAAFAALMLAVIAIVPVGGDKEFAVRSFFGIHRVITTPEGDVRLLAHGTTIHGAERFRDTAGNPVAHPVPATYYHPDGPMAKAMTLVRKPAGQMPARIGIVGLGSGAMACNLRSGESLRYFEIDQAVIDIARNPKYFRFLSSCKPDATTVLGDARLTMANEPNAAFDYLQIDAFSSDAIPVHLMTVEAIKLYLEKLSDKGVLLFHISNRHIDLRPVLAAAIAEIQGLHAVQVFDRMVDRGYDATPSNVVIVSRDADVLAKALTWTGAKPLAKSTVSPWRDDYSDVLSSLVRTWFR